jgi:hypothetical protein
MSAEGHPAMASPHTYTPPQQWYPGHSRARPDYREKIATFMMVKFRTSDITAITMIMTK